MRIKDQGFNDRFSLLPTCLASKFVRYLRWFPWKLSCAIGSGLVVMLLAINLFWIAQLSVAQKQKVEMLEQYRTLAVALDRHLMETLYQQLSPRPQ